MSTKRSEVYKCELCGNIIETLNSGGPLPQCCSQEMKLVQENTTEAATEKHIPVVEKIDGGYRVKVGSVNHPMIAAHYIEWIELIIGEDIILRQHLKPEQQPECVFYTDASQVTARAYCNLHGLWKN